MSFAYRDRLEYKLAWHEKCMNIIHACGYLVEHSGFDSWLSAANVCTHFTLSCICIYMYMYIYIDNYTYIHIYIYIYKHHQCKLQLVTTTTCASGMFAPVERRETPQSQGSKVRNLWNVRCKDLGQH